MSYTYMTGNVNNILINAVIFHCRPATHCKVIETVIRHVLVLASMLNQLFTLDFELSDHCDDHIFNWCEHIFIGLMN